MILSMSNQAVVFLTTIIVGFIIGFIYDLFRVFRKIVRHPNFLIQLEDILYWILVSVFMFYVMLNKNYGEIRAFSIVGAAIGMIFYFLTLSHLFMKVSMVIVNFFKKVIGGVCTIILTPFRILYKILKPPARYVRKKARNGVLSARKGLHKSKKYAKMKTSKLRNEFDIIRKKI